MKSHRMKKGISVLLVGILMGSLCSCGGVSSGEQPPQSVEESAGTTEDLAGAGAKESGNAEAGTDAEKSGNAEAGTGAEKSGEADGTAVAESGDESQGADKGTAGDGRFENRPNADTGEGEVKILQEGDVAPDFTAALVDGTEFKMSEHDDEIVLLNFFATWCGPCVKEMPAFGMLLEDEYEDLAILCVDCMEQKKTVDAFVSQNGYTFPIAYDESGSIETYYPTDGIPYTLVINHGVIEKIFLGARDALTQYREYKNAIDGCVSGE